MQSPPPPSSVHSDIDPTLAHVFLSLQFPGLCLPFGHHDLDKLFLVDATVLLAPLVVFWFVKKEDGDLPLALGIKLPDHRRKLRLLHRLPNLLHHPPQVLDCNHALAVRVKQPVCPPALGIWVPLGHQFAGNALEHGQRKLAPDGCALLFAGPGGGRLGELGEVGESLLFGEVEAEGAEAEAELVVVDAGVLVGVKDGELVVSERTNPYLCRQGAGPLTASVI